MEVQDYFKKKAANVTFRQAPKKWENRVDSKFLIASEQNRNEFLTEYPTLLNDILSDKDICEFSDLQDRIEDILNYSLHSRLNRGVLACMTFQEMHFDEITYSEKDFRECKMAAWAMEMIETFTVIHDDLINSHMEKRGMPSWYRLKRHGETTLNDCNLIKLLAFRILQKYCQNHPSYLKMIHLLHMVDHNVKIGQVGRSIKDLTLFNMKFYHNLTRHTCDHFLYYEPIMLGVICANINDENLLQELADLTLDIGSVYQMENDVNDVFGRKNALGKSDGDIQSGNCSWLIVNALKLANKNQRSTLFENYGKSKIDAEKRVVDIYNDLNLHKVYNNYKYQLNIKLRERIENASVGLPKKSMLLALKHSNKVFGNML